MTSRTDADAASLFVYRWGFEQLFSRGILGKLVSEFDQTEQKRLELRFGVLFRRLTERPADNKPLDFYTPLSLLADIDAASEQPSYFPAVSPFAPGLALPTETRPSLLGEAELAQLHKDLAAEMAELEALSATSDKPAIVRFLAEKYLSAVGVMVRVGNTSKPLPFYDLLHVLVPLVAQPETTTYRLATLDVSGIQGFLYNIASRRAMRSLRGRSIFLELIARLALSELLEKIGCNEDNLLVQGGGAYTVLIPAHADVAQLQEIIEQWNKRLFDWQDVRLFLAFATSEKSLDEHNLLRPVGGDKSPYQQARQELNQAISKAKNNKFSEVLSSNDFEPKPPLTPCAICRRHTERLRDIADEGEPTFLICDLCSFLMELGQVATEQGMVSLEKVAQGWQVSGRGKRGLVYSEYGNLPELKLVFNATMARSLLGKDLELRLPLTGEHLKEFKDIDELCEAGPGWHGLAAVRADVDNLGKLLGKTMPEMPLVGLVGVSRLLNLFFATYLPRLNPEENDVTIQQLRVAEGGLVAARPRPILIVYGGGDDLFALGEWSEVSEFAFDVARYWQKFVGNNSTVTLSLGLSLHQRKFPISAMADQSGSCLDQAKENHEGRPGSRDEHVKDSLVVSFSRRPFFWQETAYRLPQDTGMQKELWHNLFFPLYQLLKSNQLSRSFLRRLLEVDNAIYPAKDWEAGKTYSPQIEGKVKLLYLLASNAELGKRLDKNTDWQAVYQFLKAIHTNPKPPDLSLFLNWLDLLVRSEQTTPPKEQANATKTAVSA